MAFQDSINSPLVQFGLGVLGGNRGANPFANAIQGGVAGLQRSMLLKQQAGIQEQKLAMAELQREQLAAQMQERERQRRIGAELSGLLGSGAGREDLMATMAQLDPSAAVGMLPPEITPYQEQTLALRQQEMAQQQALAQQRMLQQRQMAMAKQQQQPGYDPFSKRGLSGAAYSVLSDAREAERTGQPLDPQMQDQLAIAQQILTSPQTMRSPTGELLQFTPGLPEFQGGGLLGAAPPAPQEQVPGMAQAPQAAIPGAGGSFTELMPSKADVERDKLGDITAQTFGNIVGILNEAKREGDTVTGPIGYAKSAAGGLARSLGIPVSPRAAELNSQLETLKTQVLPLLQQDPRVSDADMRRIDSIVGNVDAFTDDHELRTNMKNLGALLDKALGD